MGILEGKVAIVTGSTSGVGEATVKLFAKEGAKVVVVGPDIESEMKKGEQIVGEIKVDGGQAVFIPCEASDVKQIKMLIERTIDIYGKLDILYNNVGINIVKPIEEITVEMWDKLMNINLRSYFFTIKYALPYLLRSGNGVILNTASTAGQGPSIQHYVYGPSKAGVINLTQTIAIDYARNGLRANVISPGLINTTILEQTPAGVLQKFKNNSPMGKIGEPEDVAEMALFLASDRANYITGQTLGVNGGVRI